MSILVISDRDARALRAAMTRVARQIDQLSAQGEDQHMSLKTDLDAIKTRIVSGLDNLSADIVRLKDKINPDGMTAAESVAFRSDFEALAARVDVMANDPTNPDPVPPAV